MLSTMNRDLDQRTSKHLNFVSPQMASNLYNQPSSLPENQPNSGTGMYVNNYGQGGPNNGGITSAPSHNNVPLAANEIHNNNSFHYNSQFVPPELSYQPMSVHSNFNSAVPFNNTSVASPFQQLGQYGNPPASSYGLTNHGRAGSAGSELPVPQSKYSNYTNDVNTKDYANPAIHSLATTTSGADGNLHLNYLFNDSNNIILQNNMNPSSSGSEDLLVDSSRNNSSSSTTTSMSIHSGIHQSFEESSSSSPITHASPTSSLKKNSKINKQGKTKRSRMGCLTCRGRKKRCCETRPSCTECERLGLKCNWPIPGMEYRNRSKNNKFMDDRNVVDTPYGKIKILRGVVSKKD